MSLGIKHIKARPLLKLVKKVRPSQGNPFHQPDGLTALAIKMH